MLNKMGREESATGPAAAVVLTIALLIILYLILIPKDVREDVLEGRDVDFDNGDEDEDGNDERDDKDKVILLKQPGTLVPSGKEDVEEEFAPMNLFETSDLESKKIADRLVVSRSFFSNNFKDVEFFLDNFESLEELKLFMNVKISKGNIEISLNGRTFFEGGLESSDVPINLPLSNLRQRNILRFEGGSVGFAFLSKNEFELSDLELIQEVSAENKRETRTFNVDDDDAVEDAVLKFFVNCLEIDRDQGFLTVFLNRRVVFFTKIVCDASQINVDLDEDLFVDDVNLLNFQIDKGSYIIERVELGYEFDEGRHPLFFFTIDEEDFEDILDGDEVKLIMRFDADNERKRADVRINDEIIFIDTRTSGFEKDITDIIREGENFIKIIAKEEFDLVELEILLERD